MATVNGLAAQIKGRAISIPSNILEGAGKATDKQFRYFLQVSMGSCNELQTQLELAQRFNFVSHEISDRINNEVFQVYKMAIAFYNTLKTD